ncbi:rRNA processing protein Ebp2 [Schizosaccharomyces japonicus yFS275]|uniref:rRNA processing protein Ebp2 n=1 Tax=Schizosaccharomyces japonicus (strain yFS275 / FY16936) TaxID=402676 RepID=B6K460_SCHJY|nr:rRNA processing protein Ebp2 [Schizosaccharomyces japonicus yFS275]EEB08267.1 rRNA processing protein Ebp2 [Schizosaccharomyces japonicus yFS275]
MADKQKLSKKSSKVQAKSQERDAKKKSAKPSENEEKSLKQDIENLKNSSEATKSEDAAQKSTEEEIEEQISSDDEDEIELSDLEGLELEEDADIIRKRKLAINNTAALEAAVKRVEYPSNTTFVERMSVTSAEPVVVEDVEDDLKRELAFYKQGLDAVKIAFEKLRKANVPITRPSDYFAEMLKTDEHMEKIRQELIKEATAKKLSQEAKKQRELKKFGKQVQFAKQEERAKQKRETMEKINALKRKHTGNELTTEDDFDVALEEASVPKKENKTGARGKHTPNLKRQRKNEKFGHGGRKHRTKSNTLDSLAATEFGRKGKGGVKGKPNRPGKARRAKARR